MKRRRPWLAMLTALLLATPLSAEPGAGNDAGFVSAFIRLAIVVADLERAKQFYQYALGYRVRFEGDITRPAVLTQLGLSQDHAVRFAVLASPDAAAELDWPPAAMIGLLAVDPPLPVVRRPEGAALASGEGMLAVMTTDMDTVYARLQELDAEILLQPMTSPDGGERELVFRDSDRIRIHVVERRQDTAAGGVDP